MKNWIETHFNEHLKLLSDIAAIPAPSGHEDERVAFLMKWLVDNGFECYSDSAKNVIIPLCTAEDMDITCYCAHTDVVFPDTSALPVHAENGRLYAPGVGDDTANVAAILTMLKYIKEHELSAKTPVLFVLNSCEEGLGNLKGIRQIMSDSNGRIKEVVSFDCYLDGGMVTRAVGSERWRITAHTIGGHSFSAFGNPSAIHHMAKLISKLYDQKIPEFEGKTTFNAGVISGGTSVNTIAQSCEMLYEYRSENRLSLEYMREQFKALLAEANLGEADFEAELIGERPCGGKLDEAAYNALISRCETAIRSVTGKEPQKSAGSTDANIPLSLGVPAVTFGLLNGAGAHTREEWLDISSLKTGLEIGLKLIIDGHFAQIGFASEQ